MWDQISCLTAACFVLQIFPSTNVSTNPVGWLPLSPLLWGYLVSVKTIHLSALASRAMEGLPREDSNVETSHTGRCEAEEVKRISLIHLPATVHRNWGWNGCVYDSPWKAIPVWQQIVPSSACFVKVTEVRLQCSDRKYTLHAGLLLGQKLIHNDLYPVETLDNHFRSKG